jgi:hypothetical protein
MRGDGLKGEKIDDAREILAPRRQGGYRTT